MAEFIIICALMIGLFGILDITDNKLSSKAWFYVVATLGTLLVGIYLLLKR